MLKVCEYDAKYILLQQRNNVYMRQQKVLTLKTLNKSNVWDIQEADDDKAARMGIQALHDFFKAMGIPMTLTEVGIDDLHFEDMAHDLEVVRGGLLKAYVPLTHDDIVAIYRMCL